MLQFIKAQNRSMKLFQLNINFKVVAYPTIDD